MPSLDPLRWSGGWIKGKTSQVWVPGKEEALWGSEEGEIKPTWTQIIFGVLMMCQHIKGRQEAFMKQVASSWPWRSGT